MKTLVIFNGPPGSGKDWAADYILQRISGIKLPFAKILKEKTHEFFDAKDDDGKFFKYNYFEKEKDTPLEIFHKMTPRQAYIWMSETVIKPRFGVGYFGCMWVRDLMLMSNVLPEVVVVTDCGFKEELETALRRLHKHVAEGSLNLQQVLYIQTAAFGSSFANDSRNYVAFDLQMRNILDCRMRMYNLGLLHNDKTPEFGKTIEREILARL